MMYPASFALLTDLMIVFATAPFVTFFKTTSEPLSIPK